MIAKGTYLHYDGRKAEVIGTAVDLETHRLWVIHTMEGAPGTWLTTREKFLEPVQLSREGGNTLPRFELIEDIGFLSEKG